MKNSFRKILFIALYGFTSSILLHVGVMAHDMITEQSIQDLVIPCHAINNNDLVQKTVPQDCFETCLGVYDDLGGFITLVWDDFSVYSLPSCIALLRSNKVELKKYLFAKNDPPPLTIVGYARIGKEIKKME